MAKSPQATGRVAEALADGVIKPWWSPVKIPTWLRGVGIRLGWIEVRRQRYPRGMIWARLTEAGIEVRNRTLVERAERAEKERR